MLGDMTTASSLATVRERLTFALKLRRMSAHAVDVAIGTTRYTAYVASGRNERPGLEMIEAMATALRIEPAWLAYGAGPIPVENKPSSIIAA